MIDYGAGAFDQGFRQQGEHNRARRLQNRQAIQQYMSQAAAEGRQVTPDEISKFSEEISGGSNWLDAAFPTKNFSQSMIEAQNRRAQQTLMEQNAKALQTQELEQKSIGSLILSEIQAGTAEDKIGEKLAEKGVAPETLSRHDIGGLTNKVKQAYVAEQLQSPQFKLIQNEEQLDQFLQTQPTGLREVAKPFGLDMIRQRQAEEGNVVLQRVNAVEGDGSGLIGMNDQQLLGRAENLVRTTTGRADQTHIATVMDVLRARRNNAAQARNERAAQLSGQNSDRRTELWLKLMSNPQIQSLIISGNKEQAKHALGALAPDAVRDVDAMVDNFMLPMQKSAYDATARMALDQARKEVEASRGRVNTAVSASIQAASSEATEKALQSINRIVAAKDSDVYVPAGREDEFGQVLAKMASEGGGPNSILNAALQRVGGSRTPLDSVIQQRAEQIKISVDPVEPGTRFEDWSSHAEDLNQRIAELMKTDPARGSLAATEQLKSLRAVERNPRFFDDPAAARAAAPRLAMQLRGLLQSAPTQVESAGGGNQNVSAPPPVPTPPQPRVPLSAQEARMAAVRDREAYFAQREASQRSAREQRDLLAKEFLAARAAGDVARAQQIIQELLRLQ